MSDTVPPAVTVEGDTMTFRYIKMRNGRPIPTDKGITEVSVSASQGHRILVLGQNGSGKSTLLALMGGKHKVKKGSITVLGRDAFEDTTLNADVSLIGPPWPPEAYFANTVEAVTSPPPIRERRDAIARSIHLPLNAWIDKMSSGEKRRVQILFGLMAPAGVILLDECSTDIDVAERITVLDLVRRECEEHKRTCFYASHIMDGIRDWATHVMLMEHGVLTRFMRIDELGDEPLRVTAHRWMSKTVAVPFKDIACCPEKVRAQEQRWKTLDPAAVKVKNLTYRNILKDVDLEIKRGTRTLLVGCNGSGKTTLMKLMAGKLFFNNSKRTITVFDHASYDDSALNKMCAYCGDWWTKVPEGEMHVFQLLPLPLTKRAEELRDMLHVNMNWDVHEISSGEVKRVQLLLMLHVEKDAYFLDEATADLDVDQRHILLSFLYKESVEKGVTVVYTTHIFDGLEGWASKCVILDRTKKGVHSVQLGSENIHLDELVTTMCSLKEKEEWDV